ncbi:MAG: hypothetical protein KKF41_01155 [Actinobacteria bacterium]|nr:hypothetical protein [Actinomycetota bacterium]MBU1943682.1 hypothetical protein [Actinomycetota bacterium]MBU2686174.1 hypothetical protein [Actinomycetota bacterium]
MWLALLLIYLLPVVLIILVFFAIGTAASRTYRVAKRAYGDVKPYVNELTSKATAAQQKLEGMSQRGTKLTETFEEITGRIAFIAESLQETTKSPAGRLTEFAGRFLEEAGPGR